MLPTHCFRSDRALSNNSSFLFAVTTVRFEEDEGSEVEGLVASTVAFVFALLVGVDGGIDSASEADMVDTEAIVVFGTCLLGALVKADSVH